MPYAVATELAYEIRWTRI